MRLENKKDWKGFFRQYVNSKTAAGIVETLFATIEDSLLYQQEIGITNVLTIKTRERQARTMINKHTGEKLSVPSKRTLVVVTRQPLKEKLRRTE